MLKTTLAILFAFSAHAEVISFAVGMVQGEAVTSRDVQIQNLLSQALDEKSQKPLKSTLLPKDGKVFAAAAQETLRNVAIALEATNFNVVKLSSEEESAQNKQVLARLRSNSAWKELQVMPEEVPKQLRQQLLARKFIQFREQNSILPVTDSEAMREFTENHKKYGDLPFAKAKENIKSSLSHAQVERRMKDWYDGIENKYHVKNLVSEIE